MLLKVQQLMKVVDPVAGSISWVNSTCSLLIYLPAYTHPPACSIRRGLAAG
jgi:hypothetical protein